MSKLDENIFSRIALYNNYLSQAQLEECLQLQQSESPRRSLGDIFLEKGYLTKDQVEAILNVRRKKVRKFMRNPKEVRENDKSFGRLAIANGYITVADLEEALLEQERLRRINLHFRLGEILVSKGRMPVEAVQEILIQQGKTVLVCSVCDCHYNVQDFVDERVYRCMKCDGELSQPLYLDSVAVDGMLK